MPCTRRQAIVVLVVGLTLAGVVPSADAFTQQLRRYPYLTDAVAGGVTVNWATDQSLTSGSVTWGVAGAEACTAHAATATSTAVNVNGKSQYQWSARLAIGDDTRFCYRVFGGNVDLLGADASPEAVTQLPAGSTAPYSFAVFGDWGQGLAAGNPDQAALMRQMAASGARFILSTGDTGYPGGTQANYGDLVQTGDDVSGVFGRDAWTLVGHKLPLFSAVGNHGFNTTFLSMWPTGNAAASSGGRYAGETYCCVNGTTSATYPSAWYAFDQGNTRFYVLEAAWSETNLGSASAYQNDYDTHWTPGSPQYQWLQNDLAAHASQVKFAVWHYPLYADVTGATSIPDFTNRLLQGTGSLEGLLNRHGVKIGFNGHAHIYQRNNAAANGLVSYVTGGGGAALASVSGCTPIDAYAIGWSTIAGRGTACGAASPPASPSQVFHFLLVTVNGTRVTVTPTDSTGRTFDVQSYDVSAAPPPAPAAPRTDAPLPRLSPTSLAAGFRRAPVKKAGRTRTSRRRAGRIVDGRLTASDGQPIAGQTVELRVRPRVAGSRWRTVRTDRSDARARVSFRVPGHPSLYVQLVFAQTAALDGSSSAQLETHVAAKATIAASHRTGRRRQTVRFSGRLRGGFVPKAGRVVELQRLHPAGNTWRRAARRVRTDGKGRWRVSAKLPARGPAVVRFRLRIPAGPDAPFDQGFSRPVNVTVFGG